MSDEQTDMQEVTVYIPENTWKAAKEFVPEGKEPQERLSDLISAAFEEWVRWMDGSSRPTSVSEQETERVYELYSRLFLEEVPSANHLGEVLALPLGRTRYLMQTLDYRHGRMLRERQRERILAALDEPENIEGEEGQCFVLIDVGCRSLFERVVQYLHNENKMGDTGQGKLVRSGVRYQLGQKHLEELRKEFASDKDY